MSKEIPNFEQKIFVDSGRDILTSDLTPEQLEAIVSQLSDEERPKFHQLFASLAESTKSQPEADTEVAGVDENTVTDTEEVDKQPVQEVSPELQAQMEQAETLFGADFMGLRQYEKAFGFMPTPEQIPSIPFS